MVTEFVTDHVADPIATSDSLFLASKFAPAETLPFTVHRPRLIERLVQGVRGPLTVITGSAGSGKTQLVASWRGCRRDDDPVAWVTFEPDDDEPSMFWSYVVEALRRTSTSLAARLTPLAPSARIDRTALGRIAAALSAERVPVVLVLDEVDRLADAMWADDLEFVLRNTGQQLHLILVGRWSPPLPLYRYRLAGLLTEIRSDDLAFTRDEAAELLSLHDVPLSEDDLAALLEHTEGWAAGLRLCACAFQGRRDVRDLVGTVSGQETIIAEYFLGEVLASQPADVRGLLTQISVLGTFTPELAATVTGYADARRLLATLTSENAFVQSVQAEPATYRCHRLFAELLYAQLVLEQPDQVPLLHRRAAEWLFDRGQLVEALGHATKAGDWVLACTMIVEDHAVGRLAIDGTAGRVGAMLRRLPEQASGPQAAVVRASLALAAGRRDVCVREIALAERLLSESGSECGDALIFGHLLIKILVLAAGPDASVVLRWVALAETFLSVAPAERLLRHPELRILLLAAKGTALSRCGDVEAAATTLAEGAETAPEGCENPQVECLEQLALLEAYQGRLGRADGLARRALDLAADLGIDRLHRPVGADLALAWVALERYDIESADRHLRTAHHHCRPDGDGLTVAAYALVRSRRLQARGELCGAMRELCVAEEASPMPPPPEWLAREAALAKARLLIGAGRLNEARAIVQGFPEPHPADVSVVHAALVLADGDPQQARHIAHAVAGAAEATAPVVVEAWLLLAMLAARDDDVGQARESLRRALRSAAPESHRRAVYQVWTQLRQIVRDDDELVERYRELTAGTRRRRPAPHSAATAAPVMVERLSKRELDVLQGMAALLPTEEIAASMYISINTVKTHVRSILRKLAASRRNEAVRRARELRLI